METQGNQGFGKLQNMEGFGYWLSTLGNIGTIKSE